ncbi:hypothetical protein ABNG02_15175 [Halorubrum ejinorense]|uniref:Integral membrane protein n=1 Tax=Halorubrum ejinorense TaxID=425309 RepID=A0AAV3SRP1_9EURY
MSWHAVDALDSAVDVTRRLLFPFEAVRWAKLAFLALVMAGGSAGVSRALASTLGVSGFGAAGFESAEFESAGFEVPEFGASGARFATGVERESVTRSIETLVAGLLGLDDPVLVALLIGVGVAWALLAACSAAFRLVFYDALATTDVAIRRPFHARFRQGLGLFAFATVASVAAATPVVAVAAAASPEVLRAIGLSIGDFSGLSSVATVLGASVGVGAALLGAAVVRFAFEFAAPVMVTRDLGVLAAWRHVWAAFRGSRAELVPYVAVHVVVAAGVRIVQATAVAFAGLLVGAFSLVALVVVAVPLGGLGALVGTTAGVIALAVALACVTVGAVVLTLPVRMVTRTYLIAYEVSVLTGVEPALVGVKPALAGGDSCSVPEASTPGEADEM